jgi:hypothetical protein
MDKADSSASSARIAPSSLRGVVGVSQLGAAQGGRVARRGDEVAQVAEPTTGLAAKHSVDALHLLVHEFHLSYTMRPLYRARDECQYMYGRIWFYLV